MNRESQELSKSMFSFVEGKVVGSYAFLKLPMLLTFGTFTRRTYGMWYGNLVLVRFPADRF